MSLQLNAPSIDKRFHKCLIFLMKEPNHEHDASKVYFQQLLLVWVIYREILQILGTTP